MNYLKSRWLLAIAIIAQAASAQGQAHLEWPKSVTAGDGTIIDIYKPQTESFAGNILKARNAISIREPGAQDPIFGVQRGQVRMQNFQRARSFGGGGGRR